MATVKTSVKANGTVKVELACFSVLLLLVSAQGKLEKVCFLAMKVEGWNQLCGESLGEPA